MADEKLTQKTETSSIIGADIFEVVTGVAGSPLSQFVTATNMFDTTLVTAAVGAASTSAAGKSELTNTAEIDAGVDTTRAMMVDAFVASVFGLQAFGLIHSASNVVVSTGDGTDGIPIPAKFNGMNIVDVLCTVHDKGITGTTNVQIRRRRAGANADVLDTLVTIGDEFFAKDGVINTSNDDLATGDILYVDVDAVHSGTAPNGLSVVITAGLP